MRKYLIGVGLLSTIEIALVLYLTEWRKVFWNYVSVKDYEHFIIYLGIFTIVALALCVITASSSYCGVLAAIKWREKLNEKAYKLRKTVVENVAQRIQEDCWSYPTLVINLGCGAIKAFAYLVVFSIALVWQFHWIYLIIISAYAIISTLVAKRIGNPLISLNYQLQQVEATYRAGLTKAGFKNCIATQLRIALKFKHLQYFQSLYGQFGVVVPLIIMAPAYFTSGMLLGSLMQANSIMSTITDSLSFGITNFAEFNKLLSCRKRLIELGVL